MLHAQADRRPSPRDGRPPLTIAQRLIVQGVIVLGALLMASASTGLPAPGQSAARPGAAQTTPAQPRASGAVAPSTSDAALADAFRAAYNLDHDEALGILRRAAAADPTNAKIERAMASITWLHMLFARGTVLVDDYLGSISRQTYAVKPPPPELARAFQAHIAKAVSLAGQRVARQPNDASAHYDLGSALGLQASYTATIEGRVSGSFGPARRAYNAHEHVLTIAPDRKDAGLIVGTYRYVIANLSLPVRWMAYVAGFGGDKTLGLKMIEDAAAYPGLSRTDARFALILLWNRERQYDQALSHLKALRDDYPRNRLLWLETGATLLRAGRAADAETFLTDGLKRLPQDTRPRMAGEEGLWYYKRGLARVLLKRQAEAEADLRMALKTDARDWVRGRAHLELGKLADLANDRTRARAEYDKAIEIGTAAQDASGAADAQRLKQTGYKG